MTKRRYRHSTSGKPIDDDLSDELSEHAGAGYDVDRVMPAAASAAGPRLGSAPSTVDSVLLDPDLKQRLARRAEEQGVPVSGDTTSRPTSVTVPSCPPNTR